MKVETIYVLERKNLGNYEHIEMSATAKIEDGEPVLASMLALKTLVNTALTSKVAEYHEKSNAAATVAAAKEEVVKEKRTRVNKTTKAVDATTSEKETVVLAEVPVEINSPVEIVEEVKKVKAVKVTKYSSDIPEHKSIFSSYLTKAYGDTWKTVKPSAEIKAFTASLNGQDFIDADGIMVDSFLLTVKAFFGA
jgi:hypothetical protein